MLSRCYLCGVLASRIWENGCSHCLRDEERGRLLYPLPDGWREWAGGCMPVDGAERVDVVLSNGLVLLDCPARAYRWSWRGQGGDIVQWRRAVLTEEVQTS